MLKHNTTKIITIILSDSHISCQTHPNINWEANTILNMSTIKFRKIGTCILENVLKTD